MEAKKENSGVLYIVATPIGNLSDFSTRALEILKEVDTVLVEDSRSWLKIADRFSLKTKIISYHNENEKKRAGEALNLLKEGLSLALISDAGTPLISDPGYRLVSLCAEESIQISPIPGPSALIAALSVSGLPCEKFQFLGFLPYKAGKKETTLKAALDAKLTTIFYESPHRIIKTLEKLKELEPKRKIVIARELTKKFEEINRGKAEEIFAHYSNKPSIKGEFVLIISRKE